MKLLITGAFGNIGKAVIKEAYRRGHKIAVFEIDNKRTRKEAGKYRRKLTGVMYGNIRNPPDVQTAVQGCEAVIHLAAIIPPASKKNRELTLAVNYGGTVNVVNAIKETQRRIPLIFTSSASVIGPTQDQTRIVERNDPLVVTGYYEESKIRCEEFLREEADDYLIFRLAGVLPYFSGFNIIQALSFIEEIYDMHPDMRLEMITDTDVATALLAGVEKLQSETTAKNQAYILAGGENNGWRFRGKEFFSRYFAVFSLPAPSRKYFTKDINAYHLDWYETSESQREFSYQNTTSLEYFNHLRKLISGFSIPIRLFKKLIMSEIVKRSPYYHN